MGCQCANFHHPDSFSEEETLLKRCEAVLGFSGRSTRQLCTQVLVLTVNQNLNVNRLRKLGKELGVDLSGVHEDRNDPISRFYFGLKTSTDSWESRKLLLLAVLLGDGSLSTKAETLFSLFDLEFNKYLTSNELENMLDQVCRISLDLLPRFCAEYLEFLGDVENASFMRKYWEKLQNAQFEASRNLKAAILDPYEDQVTWPTFRTKLGGLDADVLTARGVRRRALTQYKKVVRAQAVRRSYSLSQVS